MTDFGDGVAEGRGRGGLCATNLGDEVSDLQQGALQAQVVLPVGGPRQPLVQLEELRRVLASRAHFIQKAGTARIFG